MSITDNLKNIDEYKDLLTKYTNDLRNRSDKSMLEYFSTLRDIPIETIEESDIFYIKDATEMLLPSYLSVIEDLGVISPTNKKPIFHNRFVIPIKDSDGKVLNLVGYSKEANERYVYGTSKYYRRRETMYGLENLHLAYELGYGILTEGITDTIRVRSLGFKNCFANCGTHKSEFIMKQLNRCRYGVIKIPDRDSAGQRALKGWVSYRGVVLNTFIAYKDVDEMCKENEFNKAAVTDYIQQSIEWLKKEEHRGHFCENQVATMMI